MGHLSSCSLSGVLRCQRHYLEVVGSVRASAPSAPSTVNTVPSFKCHSRRTVVDGVGGAASCGVDAASVGVEAAAGTRGVGGFEGLTQHC